MELAYVAHSERCALLLDADGICRWVVPKVDATDGMVSAAKRCIGAQFVATLDRETPGFMGHAPRIGANMLFALVTDGRVALVRFGPLVAFEELDAASETGSDEVDDAEVAEVADEGALPLEESTAIALEPSSTPDPAATPDAGDDPPVDEVAEDDASEDDAPPVAPVADARELEITPAALSSGDLEIVTGSFARASVRELEIEVEIDAPSDLDALDALLASKSPVSLATADSIDRSLERIVALTSPPTPEEPGKAPDDSQLDIITASFARSAELAALLESDFEFTLDTGSAAPAANRALDDEAFMADTEREPLRPSGFVVRSSPGSAGPSTMPTGDDERAAATDAETRRFSRVAGDDPFVELDRESASPRRGMLPRR